MKGFSFRLEGLRRLREHHESVARVALARELAVGARRREELHEAEEALRLARTSTWGTASGLDLVAREAFLERCERERLQRELQARSQEQEIATRRGALEQAATNHQALERLKERRRGEHAGEVAREERIELTEVSVARHVRTVEGAT